MITHYPLLSIAIHYYPLLLFWIALGGPNDLTLTLLLSSIIIINRQW